MASHARIVGTSILVAILLATTAVGPAMGGDPKARPMLGGKQAQSGVTTEAAVVPSGFTDQVALTGLVHPTVIQFAQDGRIFVAEKRGTIKVFDSLTDTTPTTFVDVQTEVDDYWDRGLLGMALAPNFPTNPWVYALYTYDAAIGATAPAWNDGCPTPPGPTTDGCVVSGRLVRFQASGSVSTGPEQVLINDWCQQFPSHSIGTVAFGPDGALYVSGGDGASFNFADYGQAGGSLAGTPTPVNPCNDPTNEGGALRTQDLRTMPTGGGGGTSYATTVMADAPNGYWRLGETSGTTAVDQTANHRNGTYSGSPLPTLGQPGAVGDSDTSILLPGTGSSPGYVSIPDGFDPGDGPLSLEWWQKRTANSGRESKIVDKSGSGAIQITENGSGTIAINQAGVGVIASASSPDTVGAWYHYVATKSGTAVHLYRNGVDVTGAVTTRTLTTSTGPWRLGINRNGVNDPFPGYLDDVAFYAAVLTPAQVAAHYAATTGGPPPPTDPATLDGAILRLDPTTGAAMAGNPNIASPDLNARRVVAYGHRNPFRFTFRPQTNELWVGDVGWNTWEEIDLIANPTGGLTNDGWPCYEGTGRQSSYDNLDLPICENLYAGPAGTVNPPYFTYNHGSLVAGETCSTANGSSIAGLAFYSGGSYPTSFNGGLFFADYSRDCIWFMPAGSNGRPSAGAVTRFIDGASNPVYLAIGPGGDLFYPDYDGGTIHRVTYASGNQPPTAALTATPTSGQAPLTVQFSGTGSTDPENGPLTYAWDFDGNGTDDASGATASFTYTNPGTFLARLRVTDNGGLSDTDTATISVNNTPPVPSISAPSSSLTWAVGDPIPFSGGATDTEDGTIPASGLSWTLVLHHCPTDPNSCHTHDIQTISGVSSGSFTAPDHEYPSWLEVVLTATDSGGLTGTTSVRLDPKTVVLSFATVPSGLQLSVGSATTAAPFTRTVIQGSRNTLTAPAQQTLGGTTYNWQSWSDGGARSHDVIANASASYTATYVAAPPPADVRVTQSAAANASQVTFTAIVTNGGPGSASAAALGDVLNSKLTFTSATSTLGTCSYASGSRTVTCSIGALASGAQATVTIRANAANGNIGNTVTVTSTTSDPNTANNSATTSIKIH